MYSLVCSKYLFVGLIMLYVMNYSVHVRIISFLRLFPHLGCWNISGRNKIKTFLFIGLYYIESYMSTFYCWRTVSRCFVCWKYLGKIGVYLGKYFSPTSRKGVQD